MGINSIRNSVDVVSKRREDIFDQVENMLIILHDTETVSILNTSHEQCYNLLGIIK